jgi:hypothetical protein
MSPNGYGSPSQQRRRARFPREADVTSDPTPDVVSGTQARPSAPAQPTDGTLLAPRNGIRPTEKRTQADNPSTTTGQESGTLILRSGTPPADQLDFEDRHDTRATESDEMARRYSGLRKDYRRDDWHKLAMSMVGFAVLTAVYLAGFIMVSRLLPHFGPWLAAKIVGLAFVAAGGGAAARSAGRVLKQRTGRPRGPRP